MTMSEHPGDKQIIEERKRRIFSYKTFILLALSIILLYFLIKQLKFDETLEAIRNSNPWILIGACFIYFLSNFFKAVRFRSILGEYRIPFFNLYTITSYHNFFNQVLPARTGELTLVYYLRKIGNTEISRGLHSLLVVRIFDFIIISAFFLCSVIVYFGSRVSMIYVYVGVFFLVLSVVVLFNIQWFFLMLNRVISAFFRKSGLDNTRAGTFIIEKSATLEKEFTTFDKKRYILPLTVTSILVWATLYTLFYVTIVAFGVQINFIQSVVGSTGGVLTNVLPINSFGSFGTLEAGWTGGFLLVGISEQDAIITGFGYHLVSFSASAFIALACNLVYRIKDRQ